MQKLIVDGCELIARDQFSSNNHLSTINFSPITTPIRRGIESKLIP